mmetsp:Transcript_68159/g.134590  ORF Transcript_68159/g.134590 Transcript_68159/m.134590 type:complete len:99 (+) Transcript_68159:1751-2047(+)
MHACCELAAVVGSHGLSKEYEPQRCRAIQLQEVQTWLGMQRTGPVKLLAYRFRFHGHIQEPKSFVKLVTQILYQGLPLAAVSCSKRWWNITRPIQYRG